MNAQALSTGENTNGPLQGHTLSEKSAVPIDIRRKRPPQPLLTITLFKSNSGHLIFSNRQGKKGGNEKGTRHFEYFFFILLKKKTNYLFCFLQVTEPLGESVNSIYNLTTGNSSTLTSLLGSGREQEAKQLIVAIASLLNTESRVSLSVFCPKCVL